VGGALEAYQAARDHFERMGARGKLEEASARIAALTPAPVVGARSAMGAVGSADRRPQRRPRGAAEQERRSRWAREVFGLVTRHGGMLRLLEDAGKLARSRSAVLVLGESGTGKELIAHGVHRLSGRSGPFVPVNCSALPREIIESELFGHVAGSFTGARGDRAGLLEVCAGGTIFLDEIAEMPVELQGRLLRFLETGEVRRVGSNRAVLVEARVVAATNRERGALERGEGFRTDLYYRLAHAVVVLPPLRRRGEDVELLVEHFLEEANGEEGKRVEFSAGAWARLRQYTWPGNVRQLKALMRRMVILAGETQVVSEGELELGGGEAPATLGEEMAQAERARIVEALAQTRGSKTEAARALGMPRTTLLHKMRRYGIG
jgi:transcriptional regulator with PAS, ATPase and Fis domain